MVSIQEKINSHFIVAPSTLEASFIDEFAQAVRGEIPYDSSSLNIEIWEDFLLTWLNGGVYEDKREYMKLLYHTFGEDFSYQGILYRGMRKDFEGGLYPMQVASYSSRDEVAFYFAGTSEEYGVVEDDHGVENVVVNVQAEGAFAFDEFIRKISSMTENRLLKAEIDCRIWEEEKIYPLPEYVLDGI